MEGTKGPEDPLAFLGDWDEEKERGKVVIGCQSLDQMTYLLSKLDIS